MTFCTALIYLQWLPIRQRIQLHISLLVYHCTHKLAPVYLTDLFMLYVPARSLHSANQNLLTVKRYNLERYGHRSFSVADHPYGTPCQVLLGTLFLYLLSSPVSKLTFFARRLSLYCRSLVLVVFINSLVSLLFNLYCLHYLLFNLLYLFFNLLYLF